MVLETLRACGRTQVVVSVLIRRQGILAWVGDRFTNYIWLGWALRRLGEGPWKKILRLLVR